MTPMAMAAPHDAPQITLGELIAKARKEAHLSQAALGALLNVHRNTVGRWEKNESVPRANELDAIAVLTTAPYLVRNISGLQIPTVVCTQGWADQDALFDLDLVAEEADEIVRAA